MVWTLPFLPSLRAFEATVRRNTMTAAAEELGITQVAVSKQIAQIERHLRANLFIRGGRRLKLTVEGEQLFSVVSRVFQELQSTVEDISGGGGESVLRICGYSNFTMRWLIPRLSTFHNRFPLINIRLTTLLEDVDFERSGYDAAIRSGIGNWVGLSKVELAPIELVTVCRPEQAEEIREQGIKGLAKRTLLHSVARPEDWAIWLRAAGISDIDPHAGFTFDNGSLAYEAASKGLGISIAQKVLILDDVKAGRLTMPFDLSVPSGESYWFVWPRIRASHKLNMFCNWLQEEVALTATS